MLFIIIIIQLIEVKALNYINLIIYWAENYWKCWKKAEITENGIFMIIGNYHKKITEKNDGVKMIPNYSNELCETIKTVKQWSK